MFNMKTGKNFFSKVPSLFLQTIFTISQALSVFWGWVSWGFSFPHVHIYTTKRDDTGKQIYVPWKKIHVPWKKYLQPLEKKFRLPWPCGPLVVWSCGPLVLWLFGPLVLWSSGPLVVWSSGPVVLWLFGPLVLWSSGPVVLWSCCRVVLWSSGPKNSMNCERIT